MEIRIGETYDLITHRGKRIPVQIGSESTVGDKNSEKPPTTVYSITYLDNSGKPNGTCRASELRKRENSKPSEAKLDGDTKSEESKNNKNQK